MNPLILAFSLALTPPAVCPDDAATCAARATSAAPAAGPALAVEDAGLELLLAEIDLAEGATCGRSRNTLDVGRLTFDRRVLRADRPVVVEFWASWCAPCKRLAPTLDAVARELAGKALVARVNFDANGGLARRLGVDRLPTVLLFHDGAELRRSVGAVSRDTLHAWVDRALSPRG